jgi:hypothetical protein
VKRRKLGYAVVATVVGAGIAWYGAGRQWRDLPPGGVKSGAGGLTGAAVHPPVTAMIVVALAAAGALLVLGGPARVGLGVVLGACGVTLVAISGFALADGDRAVGPVVVIVGALMIVDAGMLAVLRGRSWPRLGAKYEREPRSTGVPGMWEALDRGEDPTR